MRSAFVSGIILALSISSYAFLFPHFEEARREIKRETVKGITLPAPVVKVMSLEFNSLVADFLFVRTSQYIGNLFERGRRATEEDWIWLYRNLDLITEIDPYFQDPYYVGNAFLTWDAGRVREANSLLMKATDARTWDWWFPFYIGFNKFFFLGESKEAADYLLLAYKRPDSWSVLPNLAARLYYNEKQTESAIAFLAAIWENEKDENIKKGYEIRIEALKRVRILENAVEKYRKKFGRPPASLDRLIEAGIIEKIPEDPYKGVFYIDKNGAIKTTSKFAFAHLQEKKKEPSPSTGESQ